MEQFDVWELKKSLFRFERAVTKGHEKSIWIVSVLKDVAMEKNALKEAFAMTEEPLGRYFAGLFSSGRERFDFWKKSAEAGCCWGQVGYGRYFWNGKFVEWDKQVYLEWLEKAASQNNPRAMDLLGVWFKDGGGDNKEKAVSCYGAAAELGWKKSMILLAFMLKDGDGCAKDLRQAAIWSAKGGPYLFWEVLEKARLALERETTHDLDCDFDQLCYALGWGLYWYEYETGRWNQRSDENKVFGEQCLDYYCSCVELQQKSIFTFLLCWNQTTGGVKGPGQMIAKMVWEGREDNLVKTFGQ
jgi:hypothetical protein